jgi:hypothetical protein
MDTLCPDALRVVIAACDLSSLLALATVSRSINELCEMSWGEWYKAKYGRDATCDAKQECKQHALCAGRVVRYDLLSGEVRYIEGYDKTKYTVYERDEFYINAHGECFFRGSLLERDVIDIMHEPDWLEHDTLYVLTKTHVSTYVAGTMLSRTELTTARQLIVIDDGCLAVTDSGKAAVLNTNPIEYVDIKQSYELEMVDGRVLDIAVPQDRVVMHNGRTILLTQDGVYISKRRIVVTLQNTQLLPIVALRGMPCRGGMLLLTSKQQLVRYSWNGEVTCVADRVLAKSLIKSYECAYFVQACY